MGTRVYIGGLDCDTRDRDVKKFFRDFGEIREVILKRGFGFVEFADRRDADDAVAELRGAKLNGRRVTVELARAIPRGRSTRGTDDRDGPRYGSSTRTEHRVIVQNLSSKVSWQDLKDFMRQCGEVTYGDAHNKYRNEGVVDFATRADMKNAIRKLDDSELKGRRVRLLEEKARRSRSRSPIRKSRRSPSSSRSRSCSSSRSRSRSSSSSKSRSSSRSKSRRSPSKSRRSPSSSRSRSRSSSRSRSPSKSRSKSRSRSASKSRSRSASKSRRSPSKSRSRSASKSRDLVIPADLVVVSSI